MFVGVWATVWAFTYVAFEVVAYWAFGFGWYNFCSANHAPFFTSQLNEFPTALTFCFHCTYLLYLPYSIIITYKVGKVNVILNFALKIQFVIVKTKTLTSLIFGFHDRDNYCKVIFFESYMSRCMNLVIMFPTDFFNCLDVIML